MRCLIVFVLFCVAIAPALSYSPVGAPYYPTGPVHPAVVPPVPIPGRSGGRNYYGSGHSGGSGGAGGSGFHRQGSGSGYNHGSTNSRIRLYENDHSSNFQSGGGRQGSAAGGTGGRHNTFDQGYVDGGNAYSNFMPRYY